MILHGNQRGGGADLARHLLKAENEHIALHDVRGFIARTLEGAFKEAYAVSKATRCKQYLFSLSLNPPPEEKVSIEAFEAAIARVEEKLGLSACARVIVFHEKQGRRHAHAVWSRIDPETMKAVPLSFSKMKLKEVSRDLFHEHGWRMPKGLADKTLKDPANYTLGEWQEAKRKARDPKAVKLAIKDAWAMSDSRGAFEQALAERGFKLARGDRRGFLAVDHQGESFAIPRWAEQKTKDVRARLGPEDQLQTIEEAKAAFARELLPHVQRLRAEELARQQQERERHARKVSTMTARHAQERAALNAAQEARSEQEAKDRAARLRGGVLGLWDRISGQRRKIIARNEMDALAAFQRDRDERDAVIFRQLEARRALETERTQMIEKQRGTTSALRRDVSQLREEARPIVEPSRHVGRAQKRVQSSKPENAPEQHKPTADQERRLARLKGGRTRERQHKPKGQQRGRDLEL